MDSWTRAELKLLKSLKTPAKIQDFVNAIPYRVSGDNDTCLSPVRVLRERKAQCIEGAMFAAAVLRMNGFKPLIVDLEAAKDDLDHVIAVFRIDRHWGAISKTNHGVLRYREPVYRSIRELVMSYFHEYFLQVSLKKTLRTFSKPVDLSRFDKQGWETSAENIWYIPEYLLDIPHEEILTKAQVKRLRIADPIEAQMTEITQWPE
jgi:hypothetical protein